MQIITATIISCRPPDEDDGWLITSWVDADRSKRSLTIDTNGFCQREMPFRSGSGIKSISYHRDRIELVFNEQLATKLELPTEISFVDEISAINYEKLLAFAEDLYIPPSD